VPSDHPPQSAPPTAPQFPEYQPLAPAYLAGEEISGASRRLRALAALSGSLTDALGPAEAADLVEQKALSALGATSAVVVTLGPFPPPIAPSVRAFAPNFATTLTVVHAIGLPAEVRAALEQLPLDAPVPLAEVARLGEPLFLSSEEELLRYPDWGGAMAGAGARAAAIVPVWANGELRGVLGLAWAERRSFDEDERAFVLTLGVMCAQAIMRAHLRWAERQAREAAEQANRSKAHFVATISHELRTPMNAVLGYTELLADEIVGPISALQKDHLGRARASGQHVLGLIEELLSYARVEAGEEVVRAEPGLLGHVVEQSLVLVRSLADRKGLHIRTQGPNEPIELHTDPRKLRQILVNVLANAVKFTDAGDVSLFFRAQGDAADAIVTIYFEVTDTGPGMSLADQEHAFEPFWQADPTSTKSSGSTGLGLSVARQFARLLGGDVFVLRSALGAGSTFAVSIPVRYRGAADDASSESAVHFSAAASQ